MDKIMDYLKSKAYILLLALLIGLGVGLLETAFGLILNQVIRINVTYYQVMIWLLPLAGLLIVWLYSSFSPRSQQGMGLIFDAANGSESTIPKALIPLVVSATWLTHLFGGSAGREGVAVQIGGALGSYVGQGLDGTQKELKPACVTMGIAAGFAGLFETPLTGAFFAIELLSAGRLQMNFLIPSLLAAYTGFSTSHYLGLPAHTFAIPSVAGAPIASLIILSLAFALATRLFIFLHHQLKPWLITLVSNPYLRIFVGGLLLSLLLWLFKGRYSGLGEPLIEEIFLGEQNIYALDWLLKLLFTVFTLAIGFQGGEVTPLFTIGATLGFIVGPLVGINPQVAAALGYVSVFAGGTHTLIAPILIVVEIFGGGAFTWMVPVICLTYSLVGKRSIYSKQTYMY
ncbi:chloride channel protein [Hutsoniella sourekii]